MPLYCPEIAQSLAHIGQTLNNAPSPKRRCASRFAGLRRDKMPGKPLTSPPFDKLGIFD